MIDKTITTRLFFFITIFIIGVSANATTFKAIGDGKWEAGGIWDQGYAPSSITDSVYIDGYDVALDDITTATIVGNINIGYLRLTNQLNIDATQLFLNEDVTLTIEGDFDGKSYNINKDIFVKIGNTSFLEVKGNFSFVRTADNTKGVLLMLQLVNEAEMEVDLDFEYDYKNSYVTGSSKEVILTNDALLTVHGNTRFIGRAGNYCDFYMDVTATAIIDGDLELLYEGGKDLNVIVEGGATLNVGQNVIITNDGATVGSAALKTGGSGGTINIAGNLTIDSKVANTIAEISATGTGNINVGGNITMKAKSDADALIGLSTGGTLSIKGGFIRDDGFGKMIMSDGGQLVYNGTDQQTIASDSAPNSFGTDVFDNSNVKFENSSGMPFLLEGKLIIEDSLVLKDGIVETINADDIVIKNNALIKGGNANAYIDGPITKEGSTDGKTFIFPLGDRGIYAPIEISPISDAGTIFVAEYMGCPPPYINNIDVNDDLDHISSLEHWNLEQTAGTEAINVTLHWTDAASRGIDDLATLVVAEKNPNNNTWETRGNGGTTGSIGVGQSGTIVNDIGCPPPYINQFTFGSTVNSANILPVELIRFTAEKEKENIRLKWYTESEINSDYFLVERSTNGVNFSPIESVKASGNTTDRMEYTIVDKNPNRGYNYYRLQMIDLDGSTEFSDFAVIEFAMNEAPMIFPNPVVDRFRIELGNIASNDDIRVDTYNQQGQLLDSRSVIRSENYIWLSAQDLNINDVGTYYLNVNSGGESYTQKFIKLN